MQARALYPKILAFEICRCLGIGPPHAMVQVWDKKEECWKTGRLEL